jgi:hypothetical protein
VVVGGALLALFIGALALVLPAAGRDEPAPKDSALAPADAGALLPTKPNDPLVPRVAPELRPPPPENVAGRPEEHEGASVDFCPPAMPASGSRCSVAAGQAVSCGYPKAGGNVTCTCQTTADTPQTWACVADRDRPELARCPDFPPSAGSPCAPVGLRCPYDSGGDRTGCACRQDESGSLWECVPYLDFMGR